MEFTNTFHVPLPLEDAWRLMLDVPRILPCLPGARLTEVEGGNRYKGSVSVKLGPIRLSFDGQAELVRQDDEKHIAWLEGSGVDPKGRGSARSEFSFALAPAAGGTQVTVTTQLALSGSVAQYGRGSGMIAEVASQILAQFERNLAQSLAAPGAGTGLEMGEAPAAGLGTDTGPTADARGGALPGMAPGQAPAAPAPFDTGTVNAQTVLLQAQAVLSQAQAVLALAQSRMVQARHGKAASAPPAGELNMLSIGLKAMWARIRYGVAGLLGRRS
ncbi:SRPBCC family protein [Bordetella sputigena]|uniref:SRPBCC family protein n=1 Tax=Bordetella sputigena TaxID=1416810 RepID=UPI0039F122B6